MVTKVWERLAESKQATHKFHGGRFDLRNINELEWSRIVWLSRTGIVMLRRGDIGDSLRGSSHPLGVIDAKCNSLSPKTVCAW